MLKMLSKFQNEIFLEYRNFCWAYENIITATAESVEQAQALGLFAGDRIGVGETRITIASNFKL